MTDAWFSPHTAGYFSFLSFLAFFSLFGQVVHRSRVETDGRGGFVTID